MNFFQTFLGPCRGNFWSIFFTVSIKLIRIGAMPDNINEVIMIKFPPHG